MSTLTREICRHSLTVFFAVAFGLTWAYWIPRALSSRGVLDITIPNFLTIVAGYGPALAAIVVTVLTTGTAGLRRLFGRLVRWRVGLQWYFIALLLPVGMKLLAIGLYFLTGGSDPVFTEVSLQLAPLAAPMWQHVLLLFLLFTFGFDGLGEELGWRGYALPQLQARHSVLVASLILGVFWAAWHLPYAMSRGSALADIPLYWFLLSVVGSSILYTWIFNNTHGSVLLVILFHAASNTTANVLATANFRIYLFGLGVTWCVAILVVVITGPLSFTRTDRLENGLDGSRRPPG